MSKGHEPQRTGRYADCDALARDLSRWLDGRSTLARPLNPMDQVIRWLRRHVAISGLLAAIVLLITLVSILVTRPSSREKNSDGQVDKTETPSLPEDRSPIPTDSSTAVGDNDVKEARKDEAVTDAHSTDWYDWPAEAPRPAIAPFDADQAKKHQEEWAAYLNVPVEYENSIGMKFILVPPGEFLMGSTEGEIEEALKFTGEDTRLPARIRSEAPQHKVALTQPFYLGTYEVIQKEYEAVMGTNPSWMSGEAQENTAAVQNDTSTHPVESVSWNDAAEFCEKLSRKDNLKPFYFRAGTTVTSLNGNGYRLPTEAEWEFACRGGTTSQFWTGNGYEEVLRVAWTNENAGGRSHSVGELQANPLGLFDMTGNVWEWVQDSWDPIYYGQFAQDISVNPEGATTTDTGRVIRGGGFTYARSFCRSSQRFVNQSAMIYGNCGFRVMLTVDAVRQELNHQEKQTHQRLRPNGKTGPQAPRHRRLRRSMPTRRENTRKNGPRI